jgi:threonine dehydrogenase-like Zn-dependent dehydrogenase
MKMKAAIYYGPGDIRVEEIEYPKTGPEGVVLRVRACGVCNILDMDAWERWPSKGIGLAQGHEFSGDVVEVGPEVTIVKVGDRIFGEPVFRPCYKCESCQVKDYWRCVNWGNGEVGRAIHGAFAEYLWLPFVTNESIIKLPETLDYHNLALIEPLSLSIGLAKKAKADDVVVILGQEFMGLGTVACLKRMGVDRVIASDISERHLEASKEAGADIVVNALNEDVVQVVMKETSGEGADIVIQSDPRPIALIQAISMVRRMGKIWLGLAYGSPIVLNPSSLPSIHSEVRWIGPGAGYTEPSLMFDPAMMSLRSAWGTLGAKMPRWLEAVELLQSGRITAAKHVTHVFPLDMIKEAFETALNPRESIKVLVEP